ncbi:glycosyltransferase [Haemophilus paracuniculus]|uniref:Glycosyltransferase n=1 Tax=Haemophilus paracuniculus TaxID=734 RepID=A0A1T0AQ41_9PAST|nr:glycosyltransferase family 2 protein [Haemophilus paracuniculus]OOR98191.1 glycosyltransferase [Haemophilus paracuniculus]
MFSIIVPSYNRNQQVKALLENLTLQTLTDFEVIIVDDCSPNKITVEQQYPFKVTLIRNEQNKGAAGSRNIGANNAQNEWLLFLDDDDQFAPEKCALLAKAINENPTINFIYHPAECVMVNEGFSYQTKPFADPAQISIESILLANKIGGMPMIAVKKSLFEKVGGLATELLALEDYDFLLKLIQEPSFKPFYLPQALTRCTFETKTASVSKNIKNTEQGIAYIEQTYVKTEIQRNHFKLNQLYMLAYPYMMNYSRQAGSYYFKMFQQSKSLKHLLMAVITFISPKLAINMKRFI